jgi:hypothetical protein
MKLELKNIKHTSWASEETHCYQASLYVNGKPVAIVSNDGHGGADRDYPHGQFRPQLKDFTDVGGDYPSVMRKVHEYFKSLPNIPSEWCADGLPQKLEYWCAEQVDDWLSARELKKKLKAGFLFQFADKVGVFYHKTRPSRAHKATILNDLPFDEALSIWKATA